MACHTRSLSLPNRTHSFVLKAEEELNKLRACVAYPSLSYEIILDAVKAVGHVYECMNDLLCISSNQISLSHLQQRRQIDEELEESIKLLDICSISRDNLDIFKSHIQDLELAIRRGESKSMKSTARDYTILVKKANKDLRKQIAKKSESADKDSSTVFSLLFETRQITISLLQSIFSYLSQQIVSEKSSNWSLVSRLMERRRIVCEGEFDIACLRVNVEALENGLENLFRNLIQCRVSLLNLSSL
ncbi:hypothetical protein LUZ61_020012 [Rhynchospora tenuis]|uniref:Uncharacterized protein n=1 Tax=Rhynchospora tenuis TaxID=198213 RepID=A0AAD5ZCD4_9POAL|nr:hypothetical protein LUZ61_020012 [Rhynchospora tenuis]